VIFSLWATTQINRNLNLTYPKQEDLNLKGKSTSVSAIYR